MAEILGTTVVTGGSPDEIYGRAARPVALQGNERDRVSFADQMRTIYAKFPWALVIGSFGRTAIMAAYDRDVRLGLRHAPEELARPGRRMLVPGDDLRDIDVIGATPGLLEDEASASPHPVHADMSLYMYGNSSHGVSMHGYEWRNVLSGRPQEFSLEGPGVLLTGRTRILDGIPMRTPLIGVQEQIERIVGPSAAQSQSEYERRQAVCAEFSALPMKCAPLLPMSSFLPRQWRRWWRSPTGTSSSVPYPCISSVFKV